MNSSRRTAMDIKHITTTFSVEDADLAQSCFNNVSLSSCTFTQVNFSGATIGGSNMTGVVFDDVNHPGLAIADCSLAGATIDGIPVADLLAAYRKHEANED
jgi:uncharacterized protein YjbI with pentapeptide repeats